MKELVIVYVEIKPFAVLTIRIVHDEIYLPSFFFSAFCVDSAQYCANRIYSVNNVGGQPLPMKNNASLNVSMSPIGFFQKIVCISLGHSFKEKKAFPFRSFDSSLLRSDTSFLERMRISSR